MSMMRNAFISCLVVALCSADEAAVNESSVDGIGSWLRDRVDGVSHGIKELIPKRQPNLPYTSANNSIIDPPLPGPFWDPSEWHLWNATNGLLKKNVPAADDKGEIEGGDVDRDMGITESMKSFFKEYYERLTKVKESWRRPPENATEAKDEVSDPSGVKSKSDDSVIGDTDGDGIVDVSSPTEYDSRNLLPADDILERLKCRPQISFTSCFNHCLTLIVPSSSEQGYSLTQNLMYPQRAASEKRRSLLEAVEGEVVNGTSGRASKKLQPKYMPDDTSRSFDLWELAQLKNCVTSVCTQDYIKTALPGCLDGNGDVVQPNPNRVKPINDDQGPRPADDYQKLDFYDPGRLEFWHGMGFFTIQRIWFDIVHGKGLFRLVLLPCAVMILLSLPMFLLALIVPGMAPLMPGEGPHDPRPPASSTVASRPAMSFQGMDIDDYGEVIHPSSIRLCDATLANSKLLTYLKLIVDGLTVMSSKVFDVGQYAFVRGSGLLQARGSLFASVSGAQSAPGLVEMIDCSNMKYSPLPSSELIPAEEEAERGKRCPPGTGTTLPSTGKTLPSPTHEDRMYFHRFE